MATDTFLVNISGQKFEISRALLLKYPESTLSRACLSKASNDNLFFERPLPVFQTVLEFYQTDSLHVSENRCLTSFLEEIKFWGFSETDIATCCQQKLVSFRAEQKDLLDYELYNETFKHNEITEASLCGCMSAKVRTVMWNILDNYNYNFVSKLVFMLSILVVLMSTVVAVLKTHKTFKTAPEDEHWRIILGERYENHEEIIKHLRDPSLQNTTLNITEEDLDHLSKFEVTNNKLHFIELGCTAFFTFELLVRLFFCPSLKKFFMSIFNIIDVSAVALVYATVVINEISSTEAYVSNYLDLLGLTQVLRVMRLFRLTRNITGARVLVFSVKNSIKELFFMFALLGINAVTFGSIAYCVDNSLENISHATWWAIITMTTVGYGDVVPTTIAGQVVGVACACMGILLLALTIPLFVNNFISVYTFAQSKDLYRHEVVDRNDPPRVPALSPKSARGGPTQVSPERTF